VKFDILKTATFAAEAVVISTCALAAVQIATAHGGTIWACAPILTIAAMESLRVPVAMTIPRLKWVGKVVATALLIAVTPLTFEGMALAFEQFMHQRVVEVVDAETKADAAKRALKSAQTDAANRKSEVDRLSAEVKDAEAHRVELDKQQPFVQPLPALQMCSGLSRRGQRVTYPCPDQGIPKSVDRQNAEARATHNEQLRNAEREVSRARDALREAAAKPVLDERKAEADLAQAERASEDAKAASVMHRAASAWFGVDVGSLSRQQFETFKKWAMYGLAGATATVTMIAGFLSNMPRKDGRPGKVGMAWRAFLARRRKKLVRIVEKIKHAPSLKVLEIKYVPFDPASGRVINKDGSAGEFVNKGA
jgi:hypothetical protein